MSTAVATLQAPKRRLGIDWSQPIFVGLVLVLGVLVVLPLFWLAYYSVLGRDGGFTFANFDALLTDPTLRRPYLIAFAMALGVGLLSCAIATPLAWLVARTDLPGRRVVRALVTASFVTPPFLGAIAWEILAAPNSGIFNQIYRNLFGLEQYDYFLDIYTFEGLVFAIACYTFPYVFTLVTTPSSASRPISRKPRPCSAAAWRPPCEKSRSRSSCRPCWPER